METALSDIGLTGTATTWQYELVPLLALPQVDLSVSVKSRLIKSEAIHRLIRIFAQSRWTFVGFVLLEVVAVAVFFVTAPIGRVLSVVGVFAGLPGTIVMLSNFRYELVIVLLKTFDIWFCVLISSVASILVGVLLYDVRSLVAIVTWFSFKVDIFVDASILGVRSIWLGNLIGAACYMAVTVALCMHVTDQMFLYNVLQANGRALPATAVVRDGLISMTILVFRNMFRKFNSVLHEGDRPTSGTLITCVSFRCRLQLQPCTSVRMQGSRTFDRSAVVETPMKQQLRFAPITGSLDIRQTLAPESPLFQNDTKLSRQWKQLFKWMAFSSFLISLIVGFIEILSPLGNTVVHKTTLTAFAAAAAGFTILFVGVCAAIMQRQLLRAVVTSFDFLFFAAQVTAAGIATADLFRWETVIVLALLSQWLWTMWVLSWDAITPYARKRLGLTHRFAAVVATTLVAAICLDSVFIFAVLPPHIVHDRVLFRLTVLAYSMEFRALSWYCSCTSTIVTGTSRHVWRLWWATENELVLLDGPVVYETKRVARVNGVRVRGLTSVAPTTEGSSINIGT